MKLQTSRGEVSYVLALRSDEVQRTEDHITEDTPPSCSSAGETSSEPVGRSQESMQMSLPPGASFPSTQQAPLC
jgi:hypothetical protein